MKIATTAVIQHKDKILLGLRKRDGRWELPGGKVDAGESPHQCIIREVKEELGIDVAVVRILDELNGVYRGIPMKVYAFLTRYIQGEIATYVHKEVRPVSLKDVFDYDIVEEDKLILERLYQGYYKDET